MYAPLLVVVEKHVHTGTSAVVLPLSEVVGRSFFVGIVAKVFEERPLVLREVEVRHLHAGHQSFHQFIVQTEVEVRVLRLGDDGLLRIEPRYGIAITDGAISAVSLACGNPRGNDVELTNDLVGTTAHIVIVGVIVVVVDEVEPGVSRETWREGEVEVGADAEALAVGTFEDTLLVHVACRSHILHHLCAACHVETV